MKKAALDIGDQWTGIALTDSSAIIARPYHTVATSELIPYLTQLLSLEAIDAIIIGYPKTMSGTHSEQTTKLLAMADVLKEQFPTMNWHLIDERLSSKRAASQAKGISKEEKLRSHAIAAAFILDSYLTYMRMHTPENID